MKGGESGVGRAWSPVASLPAAGPAQQGSALLASAKAKLRWPPAAEPVPGRGRGRRRPDSQQDWPRADASRGSLRLRDLLIVLEKGRRGKRNKTKRGWGGGTTTELRQRSSRSSSLP